MRQQWLNDEPDTTANTLLTRLNNDVRNQFKRSQYRTLERRVKDWRTVIARQLVLGCNYDVRSVPHGTTLEVLKDRVIP